MNEPRFNEELHKIAKDLQLIWDPERGLWGIYQTRARNIVLANHTATRPWLLWHVKNDDGSVRLPSQIDLMKAQKSVLSGIDLWHHGGDWYDKKLRTAEDKKQSETDARVRDRSEWAAHEIVKAGQLVKRRSR